MLKVKTETKNGFLQLNIQFSYMTTYTLKYSRTTRGFLQPVLRRTYKTLMAPFREYVEETPKDRIIEADWVRHPCNIPPETLNVKVSAIYNDTGYIRSLTIMLWGGKWRAIFVMGPSKAKLLYTDGCITLNDFLAWVFDIPIDYDAECLKHKCYDEAEFLETQSLNKTTSF